MIKDFWAFAHAFAQIFPLLLAMGMILALCSYIKKKTKYVHYAIDPHKAHGIILGYQNGLTVYSPYQQEGHTIVFGGPGSGKTSAVLIPTLRQWLGNGLIFDISGDIEKNVPTIPRKLVFDIISGTVPYNIFVPIDALRGNRPRQEESLINLAEMIMPDEGDPGSAAFFYREQGRKILTAALLAFYFTGMDFVDICKRIMFSSWKDLFRAIDQVGNEKASGIISSFAGANEANTIGCKQNCDAAIFLFATNDTVRRCVRRNRPNEPCFSPAAIEYHNVFVRAPDSGLELFSPLLRLICAQCLQFFSARPLENTTPILFALDEFASLGFINIVGPLRKFRKRHIRILLITQALADLDVVYGRDLRSAIMNNFSNILLMEAFDVQMQEYFAKLIGRVSVSQQGLLPGSPANYASSAHDWIIPPHKLAHLGNDLILIHRGGHLRLRKAFYFQAPPTLGLTAAFSLPGKLIHTLHGAFIDLPDRFNHHSAD